MILWNGRCLFTSFTSFVQETFSLSFTWYSTFLRSRACSYSHSLHGLPRESLTSCANCKICLGSSRPPFRNRTVSFHYNIRGLATTWSRNFKRNKEKILLENMRELQSICNLSPFRYGKVDIQLHRAICHNLLESHMYWLQDRSTHISCPINMVLGISM